MRPMLLLLLLMMIMTVTGMTDNLYTLRLRRATDICTDNKDPKTEHGAIGVAVHGNPTRRRLHAHCTRS